MSKMNAERNMYIIQTTIQTVVKSDFKLKNLSKQGYNPEDQPKVYSDEKA